MPFLISGWCVAGAFVVAVLAHVSMRKNVHDPATFLPFLAALVAHVACLVWLGCAVGVWREMRRCYTAEEAQATKLTVAIVCIVSTVPYLAVLADLFVHGS